MLLCVDETPLGLTLKSQALIHRQAIVLNYNVIEIMQRNFSNPDEDQLWCDDSEKKPPSAKKTKENNE